MQASHLKALKDKREKLKQAIHCERAHAARNDVLIETMKKQKLHLKERIDRMQNTGE